MPLENKPGANPNLNKEKTQTGRGNLNEDIPANAQKSGGEERRSGNVDKGEQTAPKAGKK